MSSLLAHAFLLAQPATTAMGGGSAGGPASCQQGMAGQLPILLLMIGVMYFLLIRPQREQEKQTAAMQSKLKAGDIVRTDSGIKGEIVKLTDTDAELLIAERTKITIHRRRIAGLDKAPETAAQKPKE